jgi:hypothetical protein
MARYVHAKSRGPKRSSASTAPPSRNLLESELFGHEKGAFTGALARRVGKFEEADGGTLLLDEISEMDVRLQAKLLRAIQEREIDRVGGSKPVKVNIRILATSNRDLAQAVKDETFREDLLYRLNVVNLRLPPLRERPADVISLCEFFVKKYSAANGIPEKPIGRGQPADRPPLAGQRPRTGKRHAPRGAAVDRRGDRGFAIRLPDGQQMAPAPTPRSRAADGRRRRPAAFVGSTVAEVEQADHRHPGALPGQPHPRGQHPGHLDPHPAQQAQGIFGRRRAIPPPPGRVGAAAWRRTSRRRDHRSSAASRVPG